MEGWLIGFDTEQITSSKEVGSKAQNLIRLYQAGFCVPYGIVLTTNFFEDWRQQIYESEIWQSLREEPTQDACDQLIQEILMFSFSEQQTAVLQRALEKMEEADLFAVRSSSPEEDLYQTSFAGMYNSFLNVSTEEIEDSVRKVFASLFEYRLISYKRKKGLDLQAASIAVILQEQVHSKISGVGFSINPRNNCYDEIMIEAAAGLGERLVSGEITPDTYVVDLNSRTVDKVVINDVKSPVLTSQQIQELVRLIKDCDEHFQYPVDIEWTIDKQGLYVLQVRPITTYIPLFPEMMTEPGERKKLYVDAIVVAQGFSEPLSVLGLDLWARVMDMVGAGFMPQGEDGYFLNLHGRQYFHVSNMLKGMGSRLGLLTVSNHARSLKEERKVLIQTYKTKKTTSAMWQARRGMVRTAGTTIPVMLRGMINPSKQEAFYNHVLEIFFKQTNQLSAKDFDQAVEEGLSKLEPVMKYSTTYSMGALALSRLKRMFRGDDYQDDFASLQMMVPSNPTVLMGKAQYELACLQEIQETASVEEFIASYQGRRYSDQCMKQWEAYLNRFGYRGFKEIDLETPRVKNQPEDLFLQLKEIRLEDNQLLRAEEKKQKAIKRLRDEAAQRGKQRKFDKQLEMYERLFGFREAPKDAVAFLMGSLHDSAIRLGQDWVKEGRLNAPEEIFDLHYDQIIEAMRDKDCDLEVLRKSNLAPYQSVAHVKRWPTNIDSRGKIRYPEIIRHKDQWIGEAISAGLVKGRAKVLRTPYEKTIEPGEILVTIATEPAWTPIFINAAGVVMEIGGVLQHGAIIAREYGIPCVSGIVNATEMIHDGDWIEIDGNNGTVRKLEA